MKETVENRQPDNQFSFVTEIKATIKKFGDQNQVEVEADFSKQFFNRSPEDQIELISGLVKYFVGVGQTIQRKEHKTKELAKAETN